MEVAEASVRGEAEPDGEAGAGAEAAAVARGAGAFLEVGGGEAEGEKNAVASGRGGGEGGSFVAEEIGDPRGEGFGGRGGFFVFGEEMRREVAGVVRVVMRCRGGGGLGPGEEARSEVAAEGAAGEGEKFGGVAKALVLEGAGEAVDLGAREMTENMEVGGREGKFRGDGGWVREELFAHARVGVEVREEALGFG